MDALIEQANAWLRAAVATLQDKINHAMAGAILAEVPAILWPHQAITTWAAVSVIGILFELAQKRWRLGQPSLADAVAVAVGAGLVVLPVVIIT